MWFTLMVACQQWGRGWFAILQGTAVVKQHLSYLTSVLMYL